MKANMSNQRKQTSLGRDEALELANSKWWEGKSAKEIVEKQLFIEESCCPFALYHESLEKVFKRPVHTIEFIDSQKLIDEFYQKTSPQQEHGIGQ